MTKKNAKISIGYRGEPKSEVYLIAKNLDFSAYSHREQVSDKKWILLRNTKRTRFFTEDDNWRYWKEIKESAVEVSLGSGGQDNSDFYR